MTGRPTSLRVPRLLIVTDRAQLPLGRCLTSALNACAEAGATHVLVREHDLGGVARASLLARLARIPGLTVLSSRTRLPGYGVQLAADQPAPTGSPTGSRTGPPPLRGRSCHSTAEVWAAAADGCDYATLSPFATSRSKPGYGPSVPPHAYAERPGIPVLALGGIDHTNAGAARAAGAHGVAVMGAVMRSHDPGGTVARLLREVTR